MRKRKTHYPNLESLPEELFRQAGGKKVFRYASFCGFKDRDATADLRAVDCLLCLRAVVARARRSVAEDQPDAPDSAPDLF